MEIYSGGVSHLAPCDGLKKRWRTLLPQYAKVLKFTNMDLRNILLQLVTTEPVPRVVQPILSMEEDKKNLLCLVWCGIVCDACNKVNTGEHMMPTMKPSTRRTITTMSQGTRSLYLLRESWDRRKNNLTHHKDHDCPIVLAGVRYHCTLLEMCVEGEAYFVAIIAIVEHGILWRCIQFVCPLLCFQQILINCPKVCYLQELGSFFPYILLKFKFLLLKGK
jgi:hypothetical protein